jgi:glycosyltransferase involved in cell wall biosynthesis
LDIVGEDTLGGYIQELAAELGLAERVRFHGFLTQRELRPIVEAAHVAVISSRHEAGPVVVLEAAAVGVPTVGSAVGHIAEWSPRAAHAVPCRDPAALAAALESVLEDEDLRLRLATEAQRHAAREDADRTAHAFSEVYRSRVEHA